MAEDKPEMSSVEEYINEEIVPNLESLFWHPMLTYQYTFHSNISSYQDTTRSTAMLGIIGRNGLAITSRIASNMVNIIKERERYSKSKENLKKGLL